MGLSQNYHICPVYYQSERKRYGVGTLQKAVIHMQDHNNFTRLLSAAMAFSLLVCGCVQQSNSSSDPDSADSSTAQSVQDSASDETEGHTEANGEEEIVTAAPVSETNGNALLCFDPETLFTDRDLSGEADADTVITLTGDSAEVDGSGVTVSGSEITVTDEGVYRLTGSLTDGRVTVASEGKVQLILDDASITSSDGCALYVESAKKVFLTLADGSENTVTDGSTYADTQDGAPDAAIYSKDSLTVNGSGSLTVHGQCNEGITSKDDLVITGGTLTVEAAGDGIKGKDYVAIAGGTITVTSGGDGIRSNNDTDESKGFVYLQGGRVTVDAAQDGIQAESQLVVTGGDCTVTSGGGTANAVQKTGDLGSGGFGRDRQTQSDTTDSVSVKGLKAGSLLYITGGTLTLDTADDALHSNGDLRMEGGSISIAAGDKGLHADGALEILDGNAEITQSYEGVEGANITVSGGNVRIVSSDDGFNASDGSSQGAMGSAVDCTLVISGGYVYVDAGGDGLDSNGTLRMTGGTVIVNGPTNDGNGALDGNGSITCEGGVLIAAGSSGMAEYPEGSQRTIVMTSDSALDAGTLVTVCGESGEEVLSFAPAKRFQSIVISTPALQDGGTYTVYTGGSSDAGQTDGLYEAGGYRGDGTEAGSVTLTDPVSFIGEAGGMGFGGGMMPGGRGGFGRQDGDPQRDFTPGELPTDENGETVMPDFKDFTPGELPTDENGEAVMPDFRDFTPGELPTDENGEAVMPDFGDFNPGEMPAEGNTEMRRGGRHGMRSREEDFSAQEGQDPRQF